MNSTNLKILFSILIGCVLYFTPVPLGLDPKAWHLFSVFVATITAIVLKPYPMPFIALLGLLVCFLLNILAFEEGMAGFSNPVIWLVVLVFFIARGFIKTQLGTRLAYIFVGLLGRSTLGLGYGIAITEILIAPFMPSNAARTGGVMLPIIRSISEALGSSPEKGTEKKLGAFLYQVTFQINLISSAMFLTAMAANPMAQSLAAKQNVEITWVSWFVAASIPGLLSLLIIPMVLYWIYPPELKIIHNAKEFSQNQLEKLGPLSIQEKTMIGIFCIILLLWIFAKQTGVSAATAALLGLVLTIVLKIIDWKDVINEKEAWNTFIWLAVLVTLSTYLDKFGFIAWFSQNISKFVIDWPWQKGFLFLSLCYFYSHYFFASNTAHVSSMYAAFLAVSISIGAPPLVAALLLAFFSSLFSSMTHYGTSSGAIVFGDNYIKLGEWWRIGFIISIINLLIWIGGGGMWWKVLGLW